MQLPEHIIDLVGSLYDEGMDDETIFHAVLKAYRAQMKNPRQTALERSGLAGTTTNILAFIPS